MNDAERERLYRDRPTKPPDRPKEEIARLGDEIYERDIRRQVEADYDGEVVAIDVVSGKWSIGGDMGTAVERLWTLHPPAYEVWCVRVGRRALHHFGGRPLRSAK